MIKIDKTEPAPAILRSRGKGKNKRRTNSRSYTYHSEEYVTGERKFSFKSSIYAEDSVKEQLKKDQSEKCCFCESHITDISYGDVEHFRPKGAYRQKRKQKLQRPGYYWLAYEWDNLFLSCTLCNQRYKKNLFPLLNPDKRAISHKGSIRKEKPALINPCTEDPSDSLTFRGEHILGLNDRGEKTINILGLDRVTLDENRREKLAGLKLIHSMMLVFQQRIEDGQAGAEEKAMLKNLEKHIQKAQQPEAEYSAVVVAAVQNHFKHVL